MGGDDSIDGGGEAAEAFGGLSSFGFLPRVPLGFSAEPSGSDGSTTLDEAGGSSGLTS
jgi:hypothetical protein